MSIKKPREPPPPAHAKLAPSQVHRSEAYVGYHQERKSPAVYVSTVPRVQPKLPSPKPANPKAGSITLGTPIISQPRYEGLLQQMPPEPKMGSITQGTPIHVPHMQDKRMYDYYNKRPPMPHNVQPQRSNYPTQVIFLITFLVTILTRTNLRKLSDNDYNSKSKIRTNYTRKSVKAKERGLYSM